MDFVKQWTFCVCLTVIVSVIFSIFAPSGRMKGFYKIIISLFVFISFLYPLSNFESFEIPDFLVEESYEESTVLSTQLMVETQVKQLLNDNGVVGADVDSKVEFDGEEITVKSVQIAISQDYDLEQVKKVVFENLGINAQVIYNGQ